MVDEKYIDNLISKMTLEEKVGQMQQIAVNMRDKTILQKFIEMGTVGSFLHVFANATAPYYEFSEKINDCKTHL